MNLREEQDPSIDIFVRCHNEFDLSGKVSSSRYPKVIRPQWLEVNDHMLKVPTGPAIGVRPIEVVINENGMPGEPWWD